MEEMEERSGREKGIKKCKEREANGRERKRERRKTEEENTDREGRGAMG